MFYNNNKFSINKLWNPYLFYFAKSGLVPLFALYDGYIHYNFAKILCGNISWICDEIATKIESIPERLEPPILAEPVLGRGILRRVHFVRELPVLASRLQLLQLRVLFVGVYCCVVSVRGIR